MQILTIPNKILTSKAEEVKDFSGMAQAIVDMIQLANESNLIGLAGNQVGLLKRIFIMNISDNEILNFKAFINPKTKTDQTKGKSFDWEGCGSIPNVNALVERSNKLTITAQNISGENFTMELTGLLARVVQHEINHLDGILMTSKARQIKLKG